MGNSATRSHPARPAAFGGFRVVDEIGVGRLGPVYRAHDAAANRFVAVKLFTVALTPDRSRRLVDELQRIIAADLAHPSIVRPLEVGTWGGSVYLVDEYADGESLDELLSRSGSIPIADALGIATDIAAALDSAAVARVRHGLLGPGDVLIHGNDTRVTGFGVAQALTAANVPLPSRARTASINTGDRVDRQADIAALAAIAERLLGHRSARTAGFEARPAMGKRDAAVDRVLERALDPSNGEWFEHALEFVAALMTALGFDTAERAMLVDDRPIGSGDKEAIDLPIRPPQFLSSAGAGSPDHAAGTHRRTRPVVWALALAAVVVLMVGGIAQYRSGHSTPAFATASASRESEPARRPADGSRERQPSESVPRTGSGAASEASAARSTAPASESASKTPPRPQTATARVESRPAAAAVGSNTGESTSSMLFIDSQPRGATLFVDDKFVGTTPLAIPEVSPGEHMLRLESDGRPVWSSPVRVRANHLNRIIVPLDR